MADDKTLPPGMFKPLFGGSNYAFASFAAEKPEDRIRALESQLSQYEGHIRRIQKDPARIALVLAVMANHIVLRTDGGIMAIDLPTGLVPKPTPGDNVRIHPNTMQILDVIGRFPLAGAVCTVRQVIDNDWCEVGSTDSQKVVHTGGHKIAKDDRVVLDMNNMVVERVIPSPPEDPLPALEAVHWDDIGGCEDAKRELIEAIEVPYQNRELFKRYGQAPIKGVLLSGPPGCGKTILGRAVATSLAKTHGAATASGFQYVKGPEILSKWFGETERNVRAIFRAARAHKAKHGYPCVIFIDEAEAVLGNRVGDVFDHSHAKTIVPQFLSEMDGMQDSGAFILLATNRPTSLDPAVIRDERIDRRVHVGRPDRAGAEQIAKLHLRGKPAKKPERLAKRLAECVFNDQLALYEVELADGETRTLTFGHTASGAMVAGIVKRAAMGAMRRERAGDGVEGIIEQDIVDAVGDAFREAKFVDQREALGELTEGLQVEKVRRVK